MDESQHTRRQCPSEPQPETKITASTPDFPVGATTHLDAEGLLHVSSALHHILDHLDRLVETLVGSLAEQLFEAQAIVLVATEVA